MSYGVQTGLPRPGSVPQQTTPAGRPQYQTMQTQQQAQHATAGPGVAGPQVQQQAQAAQQATPQNNPQPNATQNMPSGTYNPLQPSYAPAPPQGQATLSGANVDPSATIQQILAGFMPQARQSTSALNNQLAAAGIVGGGAQDAQQQLQGQLASSLGPTLANAIQTSQGMGLQQSLANAAASNQMTGQNLQDWMQTNLFNAGASNQAGNTLAQMLQQGWSMPLQGMIGLESGGLGAAGGLAGQEAQNFAVPQSQSPLSFLGL